nr:hypothetical protein CFP56_07329 [Quercus suber]
MLNSLATSSASMPKVSTIKAANRVDFNTSRRGGSDRVKVRIVWTSGSKPSRSSELTGGRKTWSMLVGKAWRTSFMALDGDPSTEMIQVMWKL